LLVPHAHALRHITSSQGWNGKPTLITRSGSVLSDPDNKMIEVRTIAKRCCLRTDLLHGRMRMESHAHWR
jgi:hypothetical protein